MTTHTHTFVTIRDVLWRLTETHAAVSNLIGDPRVQSALGTEPRALASIIARQRHKMQEGIHRFIATHHDRDVLDTVIQNLPDDRELPPARDDRDDLAVAATAESLGARTIEEHLTAARLCRQLACAGLSPTANRLFSDLANQFETMAKQLALALQDRTLR